MIIKFGYYNDEDFGLTEYPEILFSEDGKNLDKLEEETAKKQDYTKYLITGIMEDFQYYELIEDFLENLKELKAGKRKKLEWDGQAFEMDRSEESFVKVEI